MAFFALPESAWTISRACLERGGVGWRAQGSVGGALRCVPLLDEMREGAERFSYPPTVAVCPRCIEVSLQSTVFHSGLDWAHGRSLISRVP